MSMKRVRCLYLSIQHDPSEKPRESPTTTTLPLKEKQYQAGVTPL